MIDRWFFGTYHKLLNRKVVRLPIFFVGDARLLLVIEEIRTGV